MVGHLALADQVLGAGKLVGKDRGDQILGLHARQLRRHLPPATEARQGERHARDPAPAGDEHGRVEQRLDQQRPDACRMQVARHLAQLETVRGGEREHDIVLGRRRLQLEVELAAKALAQRQPPGAVDAAAIGRVDDQLHAAGRVEEALEHDRVLRRQAFQRRVRRGQIFDQLARGRFVDADLVDQPAQGAFAGRIGCQARRDRRPQAGHRCGELVAATGRLAEPERDIGLHAMGVLHANRTTLDPQNAVGGVAELEDVAGHALDGEVLVHGADHLVLGLQHHLIVGVVGDRAAGGQRGEPRAAPAAQHAVDRVMMDQARRGGRAGC